MGDRTPPELDPPKDLTIPEPGSTTARGVLSRAVGVLLVNLHSLARTAAATGIDAGADRVAFQRALARALKTNPGLIASALRAPTIGALVRCLRSTRTDIGPGAAGILAELMGLIGLELARAGSLPEPLLLKRVPRRLLSLSGKIELTLPPGAPAVLFENGRVIVEAGLGSQRVELTLDAVPEGASATSAIQVNTPYHLIDGELVLALADNNPLAMMEAHPEKEGNALDLGGRSVDEWVSALRSALSLIDRYLPDLRREIDLYIHQIVPVGWYAERHLSASYQEAIGTIYMSLHPSPMTMVEAIIHEFSHNKLNALFEVDDVLENAWSPLYSSPVRPDPRPLHGVLLAVHAFLPVARLYERMLEAGDPRAQSASFLERFERIRAINSEGASVVLEHARPTRVGQGLIDEIRRWDAHYAR